MQQTTVDLYTVYSLSSYIPSLYLFAGMLIFSQVVSDVCSTQAPKVYLCLFYKEWEGKFFFYPICPLHSEFFNYYQILQYLCICFLFYFSTEEGWCIFSSPPFVLLQVLFNELVMPGVGTFFICYILQQRTLLMICKSISHNRIINANGGRWTLTGGWKLTAINMQHCG